MKAVEIQAFGGPEGLAVVDLPDPSPAGGQVLIATEAIGVGGVDAVIRSGAIAGYGFKKGHILGSEVAGTVTAVGDGVDASWVGRRVWAFTGLGGGYVEQAIAPIGEILPGLRAPRRVLGLHRDRFRGRLHGANVRRWTRLRAAIRPCGPRRRRRASPPRGSPRRLSAATISARRASCKARRSRVKPYREEMARSRCWSGRRRPHATRTG